ncbi:DUF922 domain-containing protein [Aestuariivivens marinum]|uniref:DUF922 domain-containing protein n=1 Tax=Aestuariivivens marinum TaxID=2913555 RepID=UPI001F567FBC|nr:hypothetical protein [Aestuariivivens marinum]
MKRFFIALLFVIVFSCSPKLRSNIFKKLPGLPENELVVVLDIYDEQGISEDPIGEIKAIDNGLSNNCSYYENIHNLKILARKVGANLIKLTKHKRADKWSTCDRLWAKIYKVGQVKKYEKEIEWSPDRKLIWDDFKGIPNIENFPKALAVTNSAIIFEPSSINPFKDGKLFVRTIFINHGSWVLPKGKSDYVLRHEQIHFDITEIYSRMLRKAFSDANVSMKNSSKAMSIFHDIKKQWQDRQEEYDYETQRGDKKEVQEKWEAIVELELAKYDLYKTN